jgi:hypothetical protein
MHKGAVDAWNTVPRGALGLRSIGGPLRLPLLQIGACPFPGMLLLSVLIHVTHTCREVVSLLPGFRVISKSRKGLKLCNDQEFRIALS